MKTLEHYGKWLFYSLGIFAALASLPVHAASGAPHPAYDETLQLQVSGTVLDNTGIPVAGATIIEKGTDNGTVTDFDGNFTIEVAGSDSVLEVSYLGFSTQEITVGDQTTISVTLSEDAQQLDEVILVGYGTSKRSDLTGALDRVPVEDLVALPAADPQQALRGRSAGVRVIQNSGQPGSPVSINIRGANSILGDNNPLFVVDGFLVNNIDFLNPADIKSMDILKDASATAIYGSRGANGVVIIATKTGFQQKGKVEIQSFVGIQQVRETFDLLNATQFAELANAKFANDGEAIPFPGTLPTRTTDWQDEIFRSAIIQNHNINFSGGSDASNYSVSLNYFNQEGIIINSGLERGTFRINLNHQVNDWLKASSVLIGTRTQELNPPIDQGNRGNNILSAAILADPTVAPFDADGNPTRLNDTAIGNNPIDNPLALARQRHEDNTTSVVANLALEMKLTENLTFKVLGGTEQRYTEENFYSPTTIPLASPNGEAGFGIRRSITYLNENTLNFKKRLFDGRDDFSALVGFTYQKDRIQLNTQRATGFVNDLLLNNNLGAAQNTLPNTSSVDERTILSWLGRVNYNLMDKYIFTASLRADGSSVFGENNKWGVFPSGAFAWKITNEPFAQDWNTVTNWKFRVGYGVTGNQAVGPYSSLNRLNPVINSFGGSDQVGFALSNIPPNPNLQWESTGQLNVGMDMGFAAGKYRLTLDYYIKNTSDLLTQIPLAGSTGFSQQIINIGDVRNSGLELSVGANFDINEDFRWDLAANIATNENEVTSLPGEIIQTFDQRLAQTITREGSPIGSFYGFVEDGYSDDGRIIYRDLDNSGNDPTAPDNGDLTLLGDSFPDFIFGFNNTFDYKNLNLNIFWEGSIGNEAFFETAGDIANSFIRDGNQLVEVLDFWTPTNTDAAYPAPSSTTQFRPSDRFVHDASYLRLRNVRLAYNFDDDQIPDFLGSLQIYVSGQNLWTITDYPGLDPEVSTFNQAGSTALGIDATGYPSPSTVTLGVNLSF